MKFTNWTRNVWKRKKVKIHNKQKRPSLPPEGKGRLNLRASYYPEKHLISPGTAGWKLSLSASASISVSETAAAEQKDQNPQTAVITASVIAVTAKETAVAAAAQKNQNPDQAAASASMIMIVKRTSAATVGCC